MSTIGSYVYQFMCIKHNVDLLPAGHSQGDDHECWPGISRHLDKESNSWWWSLDTSEMKCPAATDDETCDNTWEIITSS